MNKNVYYMSTSHADKFPKNSRSSFSCQIDSNEFHYFDHENISAAIKSVTFDNKFNTYEAKFGYPHMIIIQNHHNPAMSYEDTNLKYEGLFSNITIDVKSGKDYYLFSDSNNFNIGEKRFAEGKNFNVRNFTDVKIFSDSLFASMNGKTFGEKPHPYWFTIHNIYFHQAGFSSSSELVSYLNYVFHNIEYDVTDPLISHKNVFVEEVAGYTKVYMNNESNLDIYLSSDLVYILGFSVNQLRGDYSASLRELAENNMAKRSDMAFPNVFHRRANEYADKFQIAAYLAGCTTSNQKANEILDTDFPINHEFFHINKENDRSLTSIRSHFKIDLSTLRPEILGLRTNLKTPDIFKNSVYDTQVEFINVKDHPQGVQIHEVKNPVFFETTIEKISSAHFELIDISSGRLPNFSPGSPTYVHLLVNNNPKMSKRFNVFLDSSDKYSKLLFPTNVPHDFTIKLPERLQFDKKWSITLKKIFIGNDLYNIYRDSCWFEVNVIRSLPSNKEVNDVPTFANQVPPDQFEVYDPITDVYLYDQLHLQSKFHIPDMRIKNITDLCALIQNNFDENNIKIKIWVQNERVCLRLMKNEEYQLREYSVKFSPHLGNILGFDKSGEGEMKIQFKTHPKFTAAYRSNVSLLAPTNFIVLCDVVSESVFGDKSVKILKFLSTSFNSGKDIIDLSFYQDEFVDLNVKEFSTMRIQLVDATGNLIKSGNHIPTRCQVEFVKKGGK